jgi:hypothetical protein
MRIAVLGPLEVLTDDSAPVEVPGAEERLLLAVLAAGAPGVIETEHLLEILADGGSPESARKSLQAHLGRLRTSLEPGLPERASGQYVLRRGQGYALAVSRGDIDALHFGDLVQRGGARLDGGDAQEAARLLGLALGLWRGEPYAEWPDAYFAESERRRLIAIRAAAVATAGRARALLVEKPGEEPVPRVSPIAPAPALYLGEFPGEPAGIPSSAAVRAAGADPGAGARRTFAGHGTRWLVGGLVAALVAALLAARLAARPDQEAERAATVAEAERLATLSGTEGRLDVSLLLAAEAFRLADTAETRGRLVATLAEHARVEYAVPFDGAPQGPVLSGGGRTLTFGIGDHVVAWSIGSSTLPRVLMEIPRDWGAWIAASPCPTDDAVMGAGSTEGAESMSWLRMVSAADGTSRVLLEGEEVGGTPVAGVVTADGRRVLLLVAEPVDAQDAAARWWVIDVDVADGERRDTGISGTFPAAAGSLAADFADDAGSFVLWDDARTATATLVDLARGGQTPVAVYPRRTASTGFRALPSGAAQLWDDGVVTLIDGAGRTFQELAVHSSEVQDVAVSADGTWAATADDDAGLLRWVVDPATGRWAEPVPLPGHTGGVVGVQTDTAGRRLVSVSVDGTVISWDMRTEGGLSVERAERPESADPAVWLEDACAVVGRDLSRAEWRRYLPDRPYRPTCTDLP